jgi:hypothetical protein
MPRTKQTAKKSTGGSAKRKIIAAPVVASSRALRPRPSRSRVPSRSPRVTPDVEMDDLPTGGSTPSLVTAGALAGVLGGSVGGCKPTGPSGTKGDDVSDP